MAQLPDDLCNSGVVTDFFPTPNAHSSQSLPISETIEVLDRRRLKISKVMVFSSTLLDRAATGRLREFV